MNKDKILFEKIFDIQLKIGTPFPFFCPYHNECKDAFIIRKKQTTYFHCTNCDKKLSILQMVMITKNLDQISAMKFLNKVLSKHYSTLTIEQAINNDNIGKVINSTVQVNSTIDNTFIVPKHLELWLIKENGENKIIRTWELKKERNEIIIDFIENSRGIEKIKKQLVGYDKYYKHYKKLLKDGFYLEIRDNNKTHSIYKSSVETYSMFTKLTDSNNNHRLTIFTFNQQLENGMIYDILYKLTSNPYKNNEVVGICWSTAKSQNSIDNWTINKQSIRSLKKFQGKSIKELFDIFKEFGSSYIDPKLWLAVNLTFHSCFEFKYFGNRQRGTIHLSIIGDSRIGKSQVVKELIQKYEVGRIYNTNTMNIQGIVGGSVKVNGSWQITGGVLTNNHKGLITLEEVHGATFKDFHKKLTEIKSSGKIVIARSGSEKTFNARERIIEISNPKPDQKNVINVMEDFEYGIDIIRNLIPHVEDIARQDMFLLLKKSKRLRSRPKYGDFAKDEGNYKTIDFKNRILWAWSRRSDQIIISEEVEDYCNEQAKILIDKWEVNGLPLFNNETDYKIIRLAIALAAMQVSTDITYEKIIVQKYHIDNIVNFLKMIYDNDIFKINEYVSKFRIKNSLTKQDLEWFDSFYKQDKMNNDFIECINNSLYGEVNLLNVKNQYGIDTHTLVKMIDQGWIERPKGKFETLQPTKKFKKAYWKVNNE